MPRDESELGEKLPELFDIHVMFFADTSNEAITALQRAFSLERSVAEKLIADAPVMLKRAVLPDEADSLLDALNNLGAQVVLLPSTAAASAVPDDAAANLLSGGGPAWGGPEPQASSQLESSARRPHAQVVSLGRKTHEESAVLPDLELAVPDSRDDSRSARPELAGTSRDDGHATGALAATAIPDQGPARSQPARRSTPAEVPRSRGFALAALVGGVLLFAVSGYFDQSIFSGSANPLWIVVQGFGFLGVGTGCARIRR